MAQDLRKTELTTRLESLEPEEELHRLIDGLQRKIGPVDPRALASDVNKAVREVRKRNVSRPS
jgi:hypothetical protein